GFKPPYGRVPAGGPYNLDQYCHDGPLARTVGDCALLENAIAGRHWRDVVSLPDPPHIPPDHPGVDGLRVGVSIHLGDWPVGPAVVANTRDVAEALARAGARVDDVDLPWQLDRFWQAARAHFAAIFGPGVAEIEAEHGDALNDYTRSFVATMNPDLTF